MRETELASLGMGLVLIHCRGWTEPSRKLSYWMRVERAHRTLALAMGLESISSESCLRPGRNKTSLTWPQSLGHQKIAQDFGRLLRCQSQRGLGMRGDLRQRRMCGWLFGHSSSLRHRQIAQKWKLGSRRGGRWSCCCPP